VGIVLTRHQTLPFGLQVARIILHFYVGGGGNGLGHMHTEAIASSSNQLARINSILLSCKVALCCALAFTPAK